MSFSTKQAQLRPFRAVLDRLRKENIFREGLVVVRVQLLALGVASLRGEVLIVGCAHSQGTLPLVGESGLSASNLYGNLH